MSIADQQVLISKCGIFQDLPFINTFEIMYSLVNN